MTIYRARIEFLPSCHIMYKNKNNIHVRFASAQPHSLQLSGGKNDLLSPSPLRGSGRKCHFCLPQAEVNSVVPRQNGRECYIFFFFFSMVIRRTIRSNRVCFVLLAFGFSSLAVRSSKLECIVNGIGSMFHCIEMANLDV